MLQVFGDLKFEMVAKMAQTETEEMHPINYSFRRNYIIKNIIKHIIKNGLAAVL